MKEVVADNQKVGVSQVISPCLVAAKDVVGCGWIMVELTNNLFSWAKVSSRGVTLCSDPFTDWQKELAFGLSTEAFYTFDNSKEMLAWLAKKL